MKVNIITENFHGYRGKDLFSGGEILLYEYARLLLKRGHSVKVIQYGSEDKEYVFDGITIRQIRVPEWKWLSKIGLFRRFHWGGYWWRKAIDQDVDRIHFHYYYLAFPGLRFRNATGMSHGIDWDSPEYFKSYSLRALRDRLSFGLMRGITKFMLPRLRKVWSNDLFFIKYVQSTSPHLRENLEYIPNFVDVDVFVPKGEKSEYLGRKYRNKKIIILPKMPSLNRGTDIALKALKLLNNKQYVLVVVGESPALEYFRGMSKEIGVEDQVDFLGHKDHYRDLPGLMRASDVIVIPSPCREAIPLSMLEGMACGKPVVVSNIGGITDAAVDGFNSIVCKPTTESFAVGLRTVLENPEYSKELGNNARMWVERLFSRKIWENRVIAFFEE